MHLISMVCQEASVKIRCWWSRFWCHVGKPEVTMVDKCKNEATNPDKDEAKAANMGKYESKVISIRKRNFNILHSENVTWVYREF